MTPSAPTTRTDRRALAIRRALDRLRQLAAQRQAAQHELRPLPPNPTDPF